MLTNVWPGFVVRSVMAFVRSLFGILNVAALCAAAATPALADPPPWADGHSQASPGIFSNSSSGDRATDRGVLHGRIVGVDYSNGSLVLTTGHGRTEAVQVTPGTSIFFGRDGFATLSDLTRGRMVDVFVSQIAGRLVAQIIRIK